MAEHVNNRYEFVFLFDVENGNPNGDPDAGNLPRVDPETNHGLVTDVCLKRKVRNYVQLKHEDKPPHRIYVQEKAVLNRTHQEAYDYLKIKPEPKKLPKDVKKAQELTLWMCRNFYDVRTFGAVMTTEVNCGQVTGPVQLNFARSVDHILPLEVAITRMAVTNERDLEKERTIGRKFIVPYALYRAEGYVSPGFASKTGFSEKDLELLWDALKNMFDHDRSAARGKMSARRLVAFRHASPLGNAPAHELLERVKVERKGDVDKPPRAFGDYEVRVDGKGLPQNVELLELF
jgi:CRISPR-associated protein Csd2